MFVPKHIPIQVFILLPVIVTVIIIQYSKKHEGYNIFKTMQNENAPDERDLPHFVHSTGEEDEWAFQYCL